MSTQLSELEAALAAFDELVMMGEPPNTAAFCSRFPQLPDLSRHLEILRALRNDVPRLSEPVLPPNRRLGNFEIVRPLGRGGMSQVYLAWQQQPRRLCAVKTIHLANPYAVERFRREAAITSKLDHPNIAAVYGAGEAEGWAYIALQLIYGCSLHDVLAHADVATSETTWLAEVLNSAQEKSPTRRSTAITPMPARIATELARQTATGLAHAHERGIVHRDIKATNIMLDLTGRVKIIDFGIALSWLDEPSHVTATGGFIGTYDYAAPEQLQGDREAIGPWTDTYALGATLFEMLTQRPPYVCVSYAERLRLAEFPLSAGPRKLVPDTPRHLDRVVRKSLAIKPADRFQDGADFADALQDAAEADKNGRSPSVTAPAWSVSTPGKSLLSARNMVWLLLCAGLFIWGAQQRAERVDLLRDQARIDYVRDKAVADDVLTAHLPQFMNCITLKPGKFVPPVLPPRFEASAMVLSGRVQSIKVSSFSRNLNTDTRKCMAEVAKTLTFPGIGLGVAREVPLVLTFPNDSVMPPPNPNDLLKPR